jgi:hypothetical protein
MESERFFDRNGRKNRKFCEKIYFFSNSLKNWFTFMKGCAIMYIAVIAFRVSKKRFFLWKRK